MLAPLLCKDSDPSKWLASPRLHFILLNMRLTDQLVYGAFPISLNFQGAVGKALSATV